jgi:DNA replication and repair protein RecF
VLHRRTGEKPVIFLDDVMSELDSGRQNYLLNHLEQCQVFMTCCEPDAVKRLQTGALFEMTDGTLIKQ